MAALRHLLRRAHYSSHHGRTIPPPSIRGLAAAAASSFLFWVTETYEEDRHHSNQAALCEAGGESPSSRRHQLSAGTPFLSPEQVKQYLEDGFLVVKGCFTAQEVKRLRDDLEDVCSGYYDAPDGSVRVIRPEANTGSPSASVPLPAAAIAPAGRPEEGRKPSHGVLRILQPHNVSPVCLAMASSHPLVQSILGQIVGAHLPWWDGSVKMLQTMLFVRPLATAKETWHQDEYYIPTRDRSLTAMWVPLEDVDEKNGCLWVIPGSHRSGYIHSMKEVRGPDGDLVKAAVGASEDERAVAVPMKQGDALFFSGYLLHASLCGGPGGNPRGTRKAFASHYCNSFSLVPWGRGGTDDTRRIVQVVGRDPYLEERGVDVPAVRKAYVEPMPPEETTGRSKNSSSKE